MALTLAEVRAAAARTADRIDRFWPDWKKALAIPRVIRISLREPQPTTEPDAGTTGDSDDDPETESDCSDVPC